LVFTRDDGRPHALGGGDQILHAAFEVIGERQKGRLWHALRHTYATYLRSAGVRWEAVEYMMGHRLRDTTGRYVHLINDDKHAIEEALTDGFGDIIQRMLEPRGLRTGN
jgi:integrase